MQANILSASEITLEELWLQVVYECLDHMGLDIPTIEEIPLAFGENDPHIAKVLTLLRMLDIGHLRGLYLQLIQCDDTRALVGTLSKEVIVTLLWRLVKCGSIRSYDRPPAGPP